MADSNWSDLIFEGEGNNEGSTEVLSNVTLGPASDRHKRHAQYYAMDHLDESELPSWLREISDGDNIANINGAIYLYMEDTNGWMPLLSATCMKYLVDINGGYAPVNYDIGAKPYVELINRHRWPVVVLGNTITQGYKRYRFKYVPVNEVEFIPITTKTSLKANFCTIPTQNMTPLYKLPLSYDEPISKHGAISWIRDVFDPNDIKTILWMLGDMHADFGNKRMFILHGPGGVGKSSVVNILGSAVGGNITKIETSSVLTNPKSYYSAKISTTNLLDAACSRMATTADIEVTEGKILNMQTIKSLTGNDMSDGGVRVNVTIVACMNRLYSPEKMQDHARADIIRRVTVVPTRATRDSSDVDTLPIDKNSLEELIRFSIRTRLNYSMPPLSPNAVLHTLYQGRYKDIISVIACNRSSTLGQCLIANMFILWTLNIDLEGWSGILRRLGSDCCFDYCGSLWISRISMIEGAKVPEQWYKSQDDKKNEKQWTKKKSWTAKKSYAVSSLF